MKTFDFELAWRELAQPMFDTLPPFVRAMYTRVQIECGGLSQGKNLNMVWPNTGLREAFDTIPDDVLSVAARVIHNYGHWYPGNNPDKVGGHWKFSNYADQSLAARLNETLDPRWPDGGNGISFRVYEGFLRVRLNTPNTWTWREVGLATRENWDVINGMKRPTIARAEYTGRGWWDKFEDDFNAYAENLVTFLKPGGRVAEFLNPENYMTDETTIKNRKASELAIDPERLARKLACVEQEYQTTRANTLRKMDTEHAGKVWLLTRGIDTDNVIYYDHVNEWCVGWRETLTKEQVDNYQDLLREFPGVVKYKTSK